MAFSTSLLEINRQENNEMLQSKLDPLQTRKSKRCSRMLKKTRIEMQLLRSSSTHRYLSNDFATSLKEERQTRGYHSPKLRKMSSLMLGRRAMNSVKN
jgi:hypothetical protein